MFDAGGGGVCEVGCMGVMILLMGVLGRELLNPWGWGKACDWYVAIGGEEDGMLFVGGDFFPRTRFSKSRLVSSIGPSEAFSCMGEIAPLDVTDVPSS